MNRKSGFTLIELIVAISITLILVWQGLVKYGDFNRKQQVRQSALDFVSILRGVQNKAVTGERPVSCDPFGGYRIVTSGGTNTYQSGPVCNGAASLISGSLKSNLVQFASSQTVDFDPLYGTVAGGVLFTLSHSVGSDTNQITITAGGDINCVDC
jgi:prepilin-type N-terminal cleavage/methylation domain-containing protein